MGSNTNPLLPPRSEWADCFRQLGAWAAANLLRTNWTAAWRFSVKTLTKGRRLMSLIPKHNHDKIVTNWCSLSPAIPSPTGLAFRVRGCIPVCKPQREEVWWATACLDDGSRVLEYLSLSHRQCRTPIWGDMTPMRNLDVTWPRSPLHLPGTLPDLSLACVRWLG